MTTSHENPPNRRYHSSSAISNNFGFYSKFLLNPVGHIGPKSCCRGMGASIFLCISSIFQSYVDTLELKPFKAKVSHHFLNSFSSFRVDVEHACGIVQKRLVDFGRAVVS